jgi:hypothetical protein
MKQILTFLTLLPLFLSAQTIAVKSFRVLQNDMDARSNFSKQDQNGDKCAIIKIVTTEKGFSFEGDMNGIVDTEYKTGEYWVYIPFGSKSLTIKHEKLGVLRNYLYTASIKEATVYEMVLTTGTVTTIVEDYQVPTQWVTVASEPIGADVYINDAHKGPTPFNQKIEEGEYSYRIELPLYHTEAGKFNLVKAEGKKQLDFSLNTNFGYLKITTQPEYGATVTLNGTPLAGKTPVTTERLKSGDYQITIEKNMFHAISKQIIITDNQTTEENITLLPAFGGYTISTNPEAGATVILDGNPTDKTTPCTFDRLSSGKHTVTVKKEWYQPVTKSFEVIDGKSETIEFDMQPTFGTLNLTAEYNADIYIDGVKKANGTWKGRLISGWHNFEARKDNYITDKKDFEIKTGQEHQLSLHPKPRQGSLDLISDPFDATIKIDGKEYGKTPITVENLLIGTYSIEIEKMGYVTFKKEVEIKENQSHEIKTTLSQGVEVKFYSAPEFGAKVFLNNNFIGTTPFEIALQPANYNVRYEKENFRNIEKNINISTSTNIIESLEGLPVTVNINSFPKKVEMTIGLKKVGITNTTQTLKAGIHKVRLERKGFKPLYKEISVLESNQKIKLTMQPSEHRSKGLAMLYSAIVPGLGQNYLNRGKGGSLTLAGITYGLGIAALTQYNSAVSSYENYKTAETTTERNNYIDEAETKYNNSQILMYAAAGTWLVNMVWVALIPSDNKRFKNTKPSIGFNSQTRTLNYGITMKIGN